MPKWSWIPLAIILGIILGISSINWSKMTVYGVWALALIALVYASSRVSRDVHISTYTGVLLWTTALIVYEGWVDWHLWQRWHYPIDWTSLGLGVLLITIVGVPGSYLIARKTAL